MQHKVLILGATGGFGSAAVKAMSNAGWQVKALTRRAPSAEMASDDAHEDRIEWITGSLDDRDLLESSARGVDAIVHAVNVPYPKWESLMPDYTRRIIELAAKSDAHLLFVGNIYNAGIPANGVVDEHTPDRPVNEKGELRVKLERMIAQSTETGVRCTVMRFGDFFGPDIFTPNWLNECVKSIGKNRISIPGPLQFSHAWAYLPDAAQAMERVLTIRLQDERLPGYMEVPFAGHQFSPQQLKAELESIRGVPLKITRFPWGLFKLFGLVIPLFRDLVSMSYLWNHSIRIDGSALTRLLGEVPPHTPLNVALRNSIEGLS